jgi:O-methyltransferase
MIKQFAKDTIQDVLRGLGYIALKRSSYEQLVAQIAPSAAPAPSRPPVVPFLGFGEPPTDDGSDVSRYLRQAGAVSELSPLWLLNIRSAIRYLVGAGIPGDIVDCGLGTPHVLSAAATALLELGDTTRRLALFDSTADPLHRPEPEFALWGSDRELLGDGDRRPARAPAWTEPAPAPLTATGYPADRVAIMRYPREPIANSRPVAFLAMTWETYDSNRAAIDAFLPHLSKGGVVLAQGNPRGPGQRDAVEEALRRHGAGIVLMHAAADFRIGLNV